MASKASVGVEEYLLSSVVCGHHIYNQVWTPFIGEELITEKEEGNEHDVFAVAVLKDGNVVGHVPREFSRIAWHFLNHGGTITCQITGHRKFGNGLEVPCNYFFFGESKLVCKLKCFLLA